MRRIGITAALAVALVLAFSPGQVGADPVNSSRAEFFTLTCAGETIEVVTTPGQPGHVLGSTGMLIPVAFTFIGTFVDPETGEVIELNDSFSIGQGKRTGQQVALETCTFPISDGTFNAIGTVTFFRTPRGG